MYEEKCSWQFEGEKLKISLENYFTFCGFLLQILQGVCLSCYRLFVKEEDGMAFVYQSRLLEKGCVVGARALQDYVFSFKAEKGEQFDTFKEELFTELKNMVKKMTKEGL